MLGLDRISRRYQSAMSRNYPHFGEFVDDGASTGAVAGAFVGIAAGVVLPLYLGCQLTDYLCNQAGDMPRFVHGCANVFGGIITLGATGGIAIPAGFYSGIELGTALGAVAGTGVGLLDKIINSKKPEERIDERDFSDFRNN